MNNTILLIARILMGALFVIAGLSKIGMVSGIAAYMSSMGVPGALAWPTILFEILGGLALIIGFQTRYTALALGAFSVLAALIFHFDFADPNATMFKNFALAGGFLALFVVGPGAYSLDAKQRRA